MRDIVLTTVLFLCFTGHALAEDVTLRTGEVLRGTVVEESDATVVLDHPILGRLPIPRSGIASIDTGAAAAPAPPVATPVAPPPAPSSKRVWEWQVELGASGTSGNTDTSDLHAAIAGVLDDEHRTLELGAGWSRGESEGETTKDEGYVAATHDWKIADSRWFPFATARMEWDDFQDYDRRLTVGAGIGYRAVQTDTTTLKLRAGLVGTREWGSADEDDWRLEGLLGADWTWRISDAQRLEVSTTYYPDLEESGEYRLVTAAGWSIKLADAENLRLKLGLEHEIDTHRESPFEKDDLRYFGALLYEF